MAKVKPKKYIFTVGRRKEAVARVRLFKGKGETLVNGKKVQDYFPGSVPEVLWRMPFRLTETLEKYWGTVVVRGGGKQSQLEAVAHSLAKALVKANPEKFKESLKKAGLLTRDARTRERRKVGMGGKARRKKQSPKR
jgi:small subunit ribosomal protein S9